jgi:hypothetical protein
VTLDAVKRRGHGREVHAADELVSWVGSTGLLLLCKGRTKVWRGHLAIRLSCCVDGGAWAIDRAELENRDERNLERQAGPRARARAWSSSLSVIAVHATMAVVEVVNQEALTPGCHTIDHRRFI